MQTDVHRGGARADRQEWREICERVASQTELTEELASLTELLKLPLSCCLAVHQVLKEGNWAKADSPRAYIKKAAMTQARKMHLAVPYQDDTLECGSGPVVFVKHAALELFGGKAALEDERREEVLAREEEAAERGPFWPSDCWTERELYVKNPDGSFVCVGSRRLRDWRRLGEKAGLDEWQIKVLEYRSRNISRDRAMDLQPDKASRDAIQAAWKRFDRVGLKKVQNALDKDPPWEEPVGDQGEFS